MSGCASPPRMKAARPRTARAHRRRLPILPRPPGRAKRAPPDRQPRPAAVGCRHREPRAARIQLPDRRRRPPPGSRHHQRAQLPRYPGRYRAPAARAGRPDQRHARPPADPARRPAAPRRFRRLPPGRPPRHRPALPPGTLFPRVLQRRRGFPGRTARRPPGQQYAQQERIVAATRTLPVLDQGGDRLG